VPIGPWFKREVLAIAVVLAVLLLSVFGVWLADEIADRALAIAVSVVLVIGLMAHGRRRRERR
jgi:uncharacterized membrane protein YfcA